MTQPRFSTEQKRRAVELSYQQGVSLKDAAKRSGCSLASLMNWRRDAKAWVDHSGNRIESIQGAVLATNGNMDFDKPVMDKELIILQYLLMQLQDMIKQLLEAVESKK